MSEYINNSENNVLDLIEYAKSVLDGERGTELYVQYKNVIDHVSPQDVITIVDELVKTGEDISDVKRAVNKILNIFYKSIQSHGPASSPKGSFVDYLMLENSRMENLLKLLKGDIKQVFKVKDSRTELLNYREALLIKFRHLQEYEKHYQKKENILFPYFEKTFPDFRCAHVMWSMHDDARNCLAKLIQNLESEKPNINAFNFEIGKYFFAVLPVIFRENYILYPECLKRITNEDWNEMLQQSYEVGFSFLEDAEIEPMPDLAIQEPAEIKDNGYNNLIDLDTGLLSVNQIIGLFNHLPVDITFVDEKDEVRFFNKSKDRHFPRSKSIIGRKVQNCHPPESIDVVDRIVESFRSGQKDHEDFWINMKGRLILIRYFAIRDEEGIYKGTLEVSQDISDIKSLEGERRLLDASGK